VKVCGSISCIYWITMRYWLSVLICFCLWQGQDSRRQTFRSVSVFGTFSVFFKVVVGIAVFFPTINIIDIYWHILKNRDPSFPWLLLPYHARVFKRPVTAALLDCLCMECIHVNVSLIGGKICVIDYIKYTSWIEDDEFMATGVLSERLTRSKDSDQWTVWK